MAEHDPRFKRLLQEFFADFMGQFFPEQAARLDFASLSWLDKELLPDLPPGEVVVADLVARLRQRPAPGAESAEALALVHVEVESREAVAAFRRRMYDYYHALRRKHDCPVLPIAVYLRVGLEGLGFDSYAEGYNDVELLSFRFLYVGLPALEAERYVAGGNWLGVALAALMRMPPERRAWVRGEALRRLLLECPESDYRRWLLCECVEAYLALSPEQEQEYQRLLTTEKYQAMIPTMKTTYEKGMEAGEERGLVRGQRQAARIQLEVRFGPLSPAASQRLDEWPADRLSELLVAILKAPSLKDLGLED
jgi:hypothetical protein